MQLHRMKPSLLAVLKNVYVVILFQLAICKQTKMRIKEIISLVILLTVIEAKTDPFKNKIKGKF